MDDDDEYPEYPGYKRRGTSKRAADSMAKRAPSLRERSLTALELFPDGLTPDEIAAELGCSVLAIRPRISELGKMGKIVRTGQERRNESGLMADVWKIVTPPKPSEESQLELVL